NNYNALMLCIITQPHRPVIEVAPDVPIELSQLTDKCLQKERDKRLRSAGELAIELERIYARITQTPLTRPERHISLSIPPPDGTTQDGWFKVRTGNGQSKVSPAVLIGGLIAMLGLVGGGLALAGATAEVPREPDKLGPSINALVARAETQLTESAAREKTK